MEKQDKTTENRDENRRTSLVQEEKMRSTEDKRKEGEKQYV